MPSVRLVVHGHVQGVGFRYFVSRTARGMGIRGEVWNRRDGAVEIVAYHESIGVLADFSAAVKDGPGQVDSLDQCEGDDSAPADFRIGETR